jgi:hypothetical protein
MSGLPSEGTINPYPFNELNLFRQRNYPIMNEHRKESNKERNSQCARGVGVDIKDRKWRRRPEAAAKTFEIEEKARAVRIKSARIHGVPSGV